jgi:hypothetical protein
MQMGTENDALEQQTDIMSGAAFWIALIRHRECAYSQFPPSKDCNVT